MSADAMADATPPGGPQDVFYARANIVPLPLITRCAGVRLWDEEGREYIDASSGPVVKSVPAAIGSEIAPQCMSRSRT